MGWVPLAPLTLLVGENSTGKSTFLAATRLAWDLAYARTEIDFNEEPFKLGAFEQLAHVHGGAKGRAKAIELGSRLTETNGWRFTPP
jgi:predicted ATPase